MYLLDKDVHIILFVAYFFYYINTFGYAITGIYRKRKNYFF